MENIQSLLANAKINEAIDLFLKYLILPRDMAIQNDLILLKSRFVSLKRKENTGILNFNEVQKEQAFISFSILELFDGYIQQIPNIDTKLGNFNELTTLINDIKKMINKTQIYEAFAKIDEVLKTEDTYIEVLRKTFMHGGAEFDFYDRFKLCVEQAIIKQYNEQ